jgi:iron complex outermembrane receptor protein
MKQLSGRILRPFTIILGSLVLFGGLTPPVLAQQGKLEEIVVTARYRTEQLQQTPLAISAITAQDLQVRGFTDAYQIGYTVPNASLRPAQAAFGNTMTAYIRGIGQYDFDPAFEPGVAIYFDDVLYPVTMGSMTDLMDLQRVEVLRGPQGTLFGRGAIGGAIRYVSKKPQGDNTGYIEATGGSYSRIDVRAGYDFTIAPNLYARVTGVSKNEDGYQTVYDYACSHPTTSGTLPSRVVNRSANCKLGTQGGTDVKGFRGALRWAPNDRLEFNVASEYLQDNSEARADSLVALIGPTGIYSEWDNNYVFPTYGVHYDKRFLSKSPYVSYATYSDPKSGLSFNPQTSVSQWGVSGTADWKINDQVSMKTILAYHEFNGAFATDADGSPLNEQTVDGRQHFYNYQAEVRFSGRLMDRLDWTVGYFHLTDKFRSGQTVSIPAVSLSIFHDALGIPYSVANGIIDSGTGRYLVNGLNIAKSENNSGFAHAVFDLTDKWAFTAGVRYSEDKKDVNFDNNIVVSTINIKDTHFDWTVGTNYQFTPDIMGYVRVATGYRPKAYNPRPFQITQFVAVSGEEATSYEGGFKTEWLDRTARLNVTGFYIDYSKRILPTGGTECIVDASGNYILNPAGALTDSLGQTCDAVTSRTFYINVPAKVYGAEVSGQWRPTDQATFSGNFGYTQFDGNETGGGNPLSLPPGMTLLSNRPIYVPKLNWNVSASYDIPFFEGTVTPRVDVYGQSQICYALLFNTSAETASQACSAAYVLVNPRVTYATSDGKWTAAVGVNNATNKQYYLNKFDLAAFGQPTIEGQPGKPRTWYLTVRRNFD